jgi:hypothetical protein
MLMGLFIMISFIASCIYYYVEAVKNAMGKTLANRWDNNGADVIAYVYYF